MAVVRRKHIREVVEGLLSKHHVRSGPVPVEAIVRALGIEIRLEPAPDDLSGFILRDKRHNRTVIGVNQDHHPNRRRFTIGHELGHFLLHEGEQIHVDRGNVGFLVKRRDGRSADGTDVEEKEANLFAAELLMPARLMGQELATRRSFSLLDEQVVNTLAERYQVSTQALTFRLAYLGYVEL